MRVLLIDDHEVTRAACRALLRTEGVDVVADVAADDRAVETTATLAPDLVVVDVTPGERTGLEIARRIRALQTTVVLTSSSARGRSQPELDGFAFVAKADLCSDVIRQLLQGEPMTTSTTTDRQTKRPLWFLHNLAIIHARSDHTNGSYGVVELTGAPSDIPPLHVHPRDDEGFYVLDGAMRLHIGGDHVVHLKAGDFAVAPRGVPHVYVVESEEPARWLAISNGGFEAFVEEVSVPADQLTLPTEPQMPPPDEFIAIAARHGIEILGPPGTMPEQS